MAARKSSAGAVGTWVGVIVAAIGVYLTYKFLTAPRATSGLSNGFVGGGFGGGTAEPYAGTQAASSSAANSLLQKLANLLQGKKGGGGGFSAGNGGGKASAVGPQSADALKNEISAISDFSTAANNTPLSILGGESLNSYDPALFDQSLIAGESIAYQPTQLFDLSGMNFDPTDLGGSSILVDPGANLSDISIPYDPTQLFDLSGMSLDPSQDF